MSKTATKTETLEMPSFDMSKATDQFRSFAEKGVEQSKEAYARMKLGAEDVQKALETSVETARSVGSELSLKTISAMRANAEAGFSHLEALVAAKSVSEMIELQTAFLRKRIEMTVEQAKEMQAVSTKAAEDLARPVKLIFDKATTELKAA